MADGAGSLGIAEAGIGVREVPLACVVRRVEVGDVNGPLVVLRRRWLRRLAGRDLVVCLHAGHDRVDAEIGHERIGTHCVPVVFESCQLGMGDEEPEVHGVVGGAVREGASGKLSMSGSAPGCATNAPAWALG